MNVTLLDALTDTTLRTDNALKEHIVSKTSSGTPWLVAEIPAK